MYIIVKKMGSSSGSSGSSGGAVAVCLDSGADGTGFESSLSCLLSFFFLAPFF